MVLWLSVFVRVVANPFSNVFQKILTRRSAAPLSVICVTHGLLTLACLPIFWLCPPPARGEFWTNMGICTLLTVSGNVLLVKAVKLADLSVLGPVNAYKSVVSLVPGAILLGEMPGVLGLSGVALIVLGSWLIVDRGASPGGGHLLARFFRDSGVRYRIAALVLSATEAVYMKRALLASSPLPTFAIWATFGFGVSLAAAALLIPPPQRAHEIAVARANKSTFLILMITTGLMQLCTTYSFVGLQVGYALALFQTSTLISVLLGYTVFREPHVVRRLVAAVVMIAGATLIILGR